MRGCLSSVSYAILVNGNAKGWVKTSRGLRQGDPLSPFLFTIVADVLSRMLLKAEERSLLEGFRVGRNRCRVSHLQFADDTILFANSSEEELQTLKSLLLVFGQISGLKVNFDKSNLFGINLDLNHLSRLALMLDCKASDWPILYLGLPLGGNPTACGRITLLHSCLSHIPSYFLSLFKIPASVVAKVRGCKGTFFGQGLRKAKEIILLGGMQCASRGQMVTPLSLEGHCTSLLGFFQVYSVYRRRWGKNSLLGRFVAGDQIFKDEYPRLYRVVMDKNIPISSILSSTHPFSWNFNFRRNLTDYEIEDLERLMHSLDCMNLSTSASDGRSWSLLFIVKSFFIALSQMPDSSPFFPTKFVWKSQVPFKVKAFVWLVAHKKVNTNDLLQLRRPHKALSPDICKLCMEQGESADHLSSIVQ
ncbi:putative mitochondrial protein [Vitis vinifera]|uniref:Putative mitochondrial protein n=1 Tax=Vitis vinifera TaxID=29760 RepID=A0A438G7R2_VITVI|nr:putative mitochondrial protein [Vitis vinifera]